METPTFQDAKLPRCLQQQDTGAGDTEEDSPKRGNQLQIPHGPAGGGHGRDEALSPRPSVGSCWSSSWQKMTFEKPNVCYAVCQALGKQSWKDWTPSRPMTICAEIPQARYCPECPGEELRTPERSWEEQESRVLPWAQPATCPSYTLSLAHCYQGLKFQDGVLSQVAGEHLEGRGWPWVQAQRSRSAQPVALLQGSCVAEPGKAVGPPSLSNPPPHWIKYPSLCESHGTMWPGALNVQVGDALWSAVTVLRPCAGTTAHLWVCLCMVCSTEKHYW